MIGKSITHNTRGSSWYAILETTGYQPRLEDNVGVRRQVGRRLNIQLIKDQVKLLDQ